VVGRLDKGGQIVPMKLEDVILIGFGVSIITMCVCVPLSYINTLWLLPIAIEALILWVLVMIGVTVKMPSEMREYIKGKSSKSGRG